MKTFNIKITGSNGKEVILDYSVVSDSTPQALARISGHLVDVAMKLDGSESSQKVIKKGDLKYIPCQEHGLLSYGTEQ